MMTFIAFAERAGLSLARYESEGRRTVGIYRRRLSIHKGHAHNGDVWDIFKDLRFAPNYYFSHGDTDFERAFCALMDRLREGLAPSTVMHAEKKLPIIQKWAREVSQFGASIPCTRLSSRMLKASCVTSTSPRLAA
jgi:hypothetical protein